MDAKIKDDFSVQKSIGFPYKLLKTIDEYANLKRNSRTGIVVEALTEYVERHNILEILK